MTTVVLSRNQSSRERDEGDGMGKVPECPTLSHRLIKKVAHLANWQSNGGQ